MTTTAATFEQALAGVFYRATEIMIGKRRQRGIANIVKQGPMGVIDRVQGDKLERIRLWGMNLGLRAEMRRRGMPDDLIDKYVPSEHWGNHADATNSICGDTLDSINYLAFLVMMVEGTVELPLAEEVQRAATEGVPLPKGGGYVAERVRKEAAKDEWPSVVSEAVNKDPVAAS